MHMKLVVPAVFSFTLLLSQPALATLTINCKVVGVSDGDTLTCLDKKKQQHKVRLNEIDAPERKQAYGNKSRQFLSDLVANKSVVIKSTGKDRYQRVLGTIYYQNKNINLEMVKNGYAWAYREYMKNPIYLEEQKKAQKAKRGLWADAHPVYPPDFRKQSRNNKNNTTNTAIPKTNFTEEITAILQQGYLALKEAVEDVFQRTLAKIEKFVMDRIF